MKTMLIAAVLLSLTAVARAGDAAPAGKTDSEIKAEREQFKKEMKDEKAKIHERRKAHREKIKALKQKRREEKKAAQDASKDAAAPATPAK